MLIILYLSCAYIGEESFNSRLDPDNDGYSIEIDCDNKNPLIHGPSVWFFDEDGDGFAGDSYIESCTQPSLDYYLVAADCNDADSSISPTATEVCDGSDNDCNTVIDDAQGANINGIILYFDNDHDGYGLPSDTIEACFEQNGYVTNSGDCNDYDADIHPAAEELIGDGVDQNCDGFELCFVDEDNDGFGSALITEADLACTNASTTSDDCDDTSIYIYPGIASFDSTTACMQDLDGDGFGDESSSDNVIPGTDCDDFDPTIYPTAMEFGGDGVDQDCDGSDICYLDDDGDGFGGATTAGELGCLSQGLISIGGDCDDSITGFFTYPGAAFHDSTTDCMSDNDADGYGAEFPLNGAVSGTDCDDFDSNRTSADFDGDSYSTCQGDCDDTDSTLNPLDADLDGYSTCQLDCNDDDLFTYPGAAYLESTTLCMTDSDSDGYGSVFPLSTVVSGSDCDDTSSLVSPSISNELPVDGIDQNCDGFELCYTDNDGDGFGSIEQIESQDLTCSTNGIALNNLDCNDYNPLEYPNQSWYLDNDEDGYGMGAPMYSCSTPQGMVLNNTDCDDLASSVHPNAIEECDLIDNDCDDRIDGGPIVSAPNVTIDGSNSSNGSLYIPSDIFITTVADFWDWRADGLSLASFHLRSQYDNIDCGLADFSSHQQEIETSNVSHIIGQGSLFTISPNATTIEESNQYTYIKPININALSGEFTVQMTIKPDLSTVDELNEANVNAEKMVLFSQGYTRVLLKNLGYDTGQTGIIVRNCLGEVQESCSSGTFSGLLSPEQKHTYTVSRDSGGEITIFQDDVQLQGSFSMPSIYPDQLLIGTYFTDAELMVFQGVLESFLIFPFSLTSSDLSTIYDEDWARIPEGLIKPETNINVAAYNIDVSGQGLSESTIAEISMECASISDCDNDGFPNSSDCDDEDPSIHTETDIPIVYSIDIDATDNTYTSFFMEESIYSSTGTDVDIFEITYTEFQYIFQTFSRENTTNMDAFACSIYSQDVELEVLITGPQGYEYYLFVEANDTQQFIVDEITDTNQDGIYTVFIQGTANSCANTYEISCFEYY